MKLFLLCVLAALLTVVGCTDKDEIPSTVLPKQKMEKVLWDMIVADRFAAMYVYKDSVKKNVKIETLKLYEQVFQINKISKDQFVKSFNFYLSRPDISKVMFDSLSARSARRQADVFTTPKAPTAPTVPIAPKSN